MHNQANDCVDSDAPPLVKQAFWCGCVFSLAVLIAVLNCLPPVNVYFRVRAQVVASPQRLDALKAKLRGDQVSSVESLEGGIQLCSLKLLDGPRHPVEADSSSGENVKLVEVQARSLHRTTTALFRKWLDSISRVRESLSVDGQVLQKYRFAQWQAEAAEHYLAHHLHTSEAHQSFTDAAGAQEALSLNDKSPMRLVGFPRNQPDARPADSADSVPDSAAAVLELERVRDQLELDLQSAQDAALHATKERDKLAAMAFGTLAISGSPEVCAEAGSIPAWMASSVLVFALACGSCAGWLRHRLQSGGAFDPEVVANQLAADGLAVIDRLNLGGVVSDPEDWFEATSRTAAMLSRRFARGMTSISEWALMIWCCGIAIRFILDPLWRNVLVESPLAGLGRLVIGLP